MKISELVEKLSFIRESMGDMDVFVIGDSVVGIRVELAPKGAFAEIIGTDMYDGDEET